MRVSPHPGAARHPSPLRGRGVTKELTLLLVVPPLSRAVVRERGLGGEGLTTTLAADRARSHSATAPRLLHRPLPRHHRPAAASRPCVGPAPATFGRPGGHPRG